jgi:hypothetical protein
VVWLKHVLVPSTSQVNIAAQVPKELQRVVTSFVPTKAQAKLDAFLKDFTGDPDAYVEYNNDHYTTVYRATEPNDPHARQDSAGKWGRLEGHYYFGYRPEMRRVWADRIESTVEYCEENYEDYEDVDEVIADWESQLLVTLLAKSCSTSGTVRLCTLLRGELKAAITLHVSNGSSNASVGSPTLPCARPAKRVETRGGRLWD